MIIILSENLLYETHDFNVNNALNIECYPNWDSTKYKEIYGINDAKTIIWGTLWYKGFAEIFAAFKTCGFLSESLIPKGAKSWINVLEQMPNFITSF